MHSADRRFIAGILSAASAITLAACGSNEPSSTGVDTTTNTVDTGNTRVAECTGDNAGLTLPAGICATIFADSVGPARHVAVASNGDVYVAIDQSGPASPGFVLALRDTNGDGRADITARIGNVGNTGVGLYNGYLYVDEGARIVRYRRGDTELTPSGPREVVVDGMPFGAGHRSRPFAFGNDGSLYVDVGSFSNSCERQGGINEPPGSDPCTELNTRGGIWRFDANRTGQSFSPDARFASGIRNAIALTVHPGDGALYAVQHGRDQLRRLWPTLFPSPQYQAANPGEELIQVSQGDDFGWPYCYYGTDVKTLVTAPEYGGDGKKTDRCAGKRGPVTAFPGHWAPMSLLFYTGSMLPARYRDGAFVAFHGSWDRSPEPQAGYNVVFQPMANGQASGQYEVFADGFAGLPATELQPDEAKHRPVGLAQGSDGALYITDDAGGRVYRLTTTRSGQ